MLSDAKPAPRDKSAPLGSANTLTGSASLAQGNTSALLERVYRHPAALPEAALQRSRHLVDNNSRLRAFAQKLIAGAPHPYCSTNFTVAVPT